MAATANELTSKIWWDPAKVSWTFDRITWRNPHLDAERPILQIEEVGLVRHCALEPHRSIGRPRLSTLEVPDALVLPIHNPCCFSGMLDRRALSSRIPDTICRHKLNVNRDSVVPELHEAK